jgi:hypothetical protein
MGQDTLTLHKIPIWEIVNRDLKPTGLDSIILTTFIDSSSSTWGGQRCVYIYNTHTHTHTHTHLAQSP